MPSTTWASSPEETSARPELLAQMAYDDDVATAVAASLECPQGVPITHRRSVTEWSPKTREDWTTYTRQKEAVAEAEKYKDSPDYYKAVAKSLQENGQPNPQNQTAMSSPPVARSASLEEPPKSRPLSLDDLIADMAVKTALEVPRVNEPNGDTWVYIDAPPCQPEQDAESYRRYVERSRSPMVMHSATILSRLGSQYFDLEKEMSPTAQHRIKRRRGLVSQLPSHIKYVLDLTPPSEGEDAAHLLSELSCSEGVMKWIIAGKLWRISKTLIGGQEEFSPYDRTAADATFQTLKSEIQRSNAGEAEKRHQILHLEESILPVPLPYTPLRHRSAIERVLLAIAGTDPELNTAPKVWTACAVAKYFGVKILFDDYVIRWLRADPNNRFLEVLPEVSLKIADILQCQELCRDVFAILVGEEALGSLYRSRSQILRPQVVRGTISIHGRKKDHLPEEYQTRIEYASKALAERVTAEFMRLASCDWIEQLPEVSKILSKTQPEIRICVPSLLSTLKAYVRGSIYRMLCANYFIPNLIEHLDYQKTNGLFPIGTRLQVWNELLPRERLLTRSFWQSLTTHRLDTGFSNMHVQGQYTEDIPLDEVSAAEEELRRDGVFQVVKKEDLDAKAALYQQMSHVREHNQPMLRFDPADSTSPTGYVSVLWVPTNVASTPGILNHGNRHRDALLLNSQVPIAEGGYLVIKEPRPQYQRNANNLFDQTPMRPILTKARHLTVQEHTNVCGFVKLWFWDDGQILSQALRLPYEYFGLLEAAGTETGINRVKIPRLDYWDTWAEKWLCAFEGGLGAFEKPHDKYHHSFSLDRFFEQANSYLVHTVTNGMLAMTDKTTRAVAHPLSLCDFIVSLEESEFKYLPLWAGGNDDASGGVYDEDVPIAPQGFTTPGPNVHFGTGSSAASSEYEFISGVNSHNTSTLTQGLSEGAPSTNVRSISEHDSDPFADAEQVRAPSTLDDSEYDFGSTTSVGAESIAERLARFGLDINTQISERAKGKRPIRNKTTQDAAPTLNPGEQEMANESLSGQPAEKKADIDEDFDSIFDDDDDDEMEDDADENEFDDGNDSDETIGEAKDSDDDLVLV